MVVSNVQQRCMNISEIIMLARDSFRSPVLSTAIRVQMIAKHGTRGGAAWDAALAGIQGGMKPTATWPLVETALLGRAV